MKRGKKVKGGRPRKGHVKFKWSTAPDVLEECRRRAAQEPCDVSDKITALVRRGMEAEKQVA